MKLNIYTKGCEIIQSTKLYIDITEPWTEFQLINLS